DLVVVGDQRAVHHAVGVEGEHVVLVGCRGDAERFDAQDLPDVASVLVCAVHPAAGQLELRMIQHALDGGLADTSGGPLNDTQLGGVTHAWHSMTKWAPLSTTTKRLPMRALDGKIVILSGTSRGVGVGTAHELLRAGAPVVGCPRSPL